MFVQPRNPVAFLPGSDAYMDNWCDIKCRNGTNALSFLTELNRPGLAIGNFNIPTGYFNIRYIRYKMYAKHTN